MAKIEDERIMTLHPQGRKGVNILKKKYDMVAEYIIRKVREAGEITYQDISDDAEEDFEGKFEGKIIWYVITVKLDLEARGIIERIPKTSPHKLRMGKVKVEI